MTPKPIDTQVGQMRRDSFGALFTVRNRRRDMNIDCGISFDVVYETGQSRWLASSALNAFSIYASGPVEHDEYILGELRRSAAIKVLPEGVNKDAMEAALIKFQVDWSSVDRASDLLPFVTSIIAAYSDALPRAV